MMRNKRAIGAPGQHHRRQEKGSVFFYIFVGVILFGALAYTVSRSMSAQGTQALPNREADLVAADLLNYAQQLERAVDRVRRNGCSENDISFHDAGWGHTDYEHSPSASSECLVFGTDGGGLTFKNLSQNRSAYIEGLSSIIIAADNAIDGAATTCTAATCTDLVLVVRMFHANNICLQINKMTDFASTVPSSAGIGIATLFDGAYTYDSTISGALDSKTSGCYAHSSATYSDGSAYYDFYYVLLER